MEVADDVSLVIELHYTLALISTLLKVLYANALPLTSHVSPDFVPVFGDCIRMLRFVINTSPIKRFGSEIWLINTLILV